MTKPQRKPKSANFSSGPCDKHKDWRLEQIDRQIFGRSHRSKLGKERIKMAFQLTREILQIPDDYELGMIAGSDTGAFECAMWSFLGPRKIDAFAWESFGQGWVTDITKQLKLDANLHLADYGNLPDFSKADENNDLVFTWNGTTSGAKIPNADWISAERKGITLCDATSAVFAMDIEWDKIDVLTFSWQKCLGGEGAHGMMVLSPKAVERLESYDPSWPMPKIFRLKKNGKLNKAIFTDSPINTPSMLVFEEYIMNLQWAKKIGGLPALIKRSADNLQSVETWIAHNPSFQFLTHNKDFRSNTSICIAISDDSFIKQTPDQQKSIILKMVQLMEDDQIAYDIKHYIDAPMGFRFWCGPTIENSDLEIALEWLAYNFNHVVNG